MLLATCVRGKSVFFESFRQTSIEHFALRQEQQRTPDEGVLVGIRSGGGRKNTLFNINTTITATKTNNNNNNNRNYCPNVSTEPEQGKIRKALKFSNNILIDYTLLKI